MKSHLVLDFESIQGKVIWVHGENQSFDWGIVNLNKFSGEEFLAYEPEIISEIGLNKIKHSKEFLEQHNILVKFADEVNKYNSLNIVKTHIKNIDLISKDEIDYLVKMTGNKKIKPAIQLLFL